MVQRVRNGVSLQVDFSAVSKTIGAANAMIESVEDDRYIGELVRAAHATVEEEFNIEAAAYAAAGGPIRHMYEWGTLGINTGRTNVRPNPLQPRARLWENVLTGNGLNQNLTYIFKPSVAIVPKPTRRDTNMDQEVIDALSDHVFTWKAMVLESGMKVYIKPVNAKFLILPVFNDNIQGWAKPRDIERGFAVSKAPKYFAPGRNTTEGNFTAFWLQFWEGRGEDLMNKYIEENINLDFLPKIVRPKRSSVRPARPGKVLSDAKAEERRLRRNALARARYRKRKEEAMKNGE